MEAIGSRDKIQTSNREQFLLDRKAGIGGSDVGAIMGLSAFKTALDVYLDKTSYSYIEEEYSNNLRRGNRAEKYILEEYAETKADRCKISIYDWPYRRQSQRPECNSRGKIYQDVT